MSNVVLDPQEFRRALGSFATGVTIITTRTAEGALLGLTVNSFNSVSLNPPLVLWSLANSSLSLEAFKQAPVWAVHVLASDQEELSGRFARRGIDKFAGLEFDEGIDGIPLLRGCSARFQCRTAFQQEGGDHIIFVGEVLSFDRSDVAPLVFHGGRYAHATKREPSTQKPRNAYLDGSFSDDFLGYLLGRGHFQFFAQIRPHLQAEGLSDEDFYVLSTLTLKQSMTAQELDGSMAGILGERSSGTLRALVQRGLASEAPVVAEVERTEFQLTELGREVALRVIAAAKAVELRTIERLSGDDGAALKILLRQLLSAIDPEAAALWDGSGARKVSTSGPGWTE